MVQKSEFTTKGELVYLPIVEGEYCPRTANACIGEECKDHGENGCKIYFRGSLQTMIKFPKGKQNVHDLASRVVMNETPNAN